MADGSMHVLGFAFVWKSRLLIAVSIISIAIIWLSMKYTHIIYRFLLVSCLPCQLPRFCLNDAIQFIGTYGVLDVVEKGRRIAGKFCLKVKQNFIHLFVISFIY